MSRTLSAGILMAVCALAQQDAPTEPLCHAARAGNLTEVRLLLAQGVSANLRDQRDGRTPLMCAASLQARSGFDEDKQPGADRLAVATLLLDRGADVNARDNRERTPLLNAMEGAASESRVIGADEQMARLLISRGADVNAQDRDGWSPLLRAVSLWADQPDLFLFLLAKGADVRARLQDGRTSLILATQLGKLDRLQSLIDKCAGVNDSDLRGTTALMAAAVGGTMSRWRS